MEPNFLRENWFKISIVLALLVVAFSVYYSLVVAPQKTLRQEEASRRAKETERQQNIDLCLSNAYDVYTSNWLGSCRDLRKLTGNCEAILFAPEPFTQYLDLYPLLKESDLLTQIRAFEKTKEDCSCSLPTTVGDRWDQTYKEAQQACYDRY